MSRFALLAGSAAIVLSGCYYHDGYYYEPHFGYYDDDYYFYGAYYDGYYGPYLGGYWGVDGYFYYADHDHKYHRDHARHFQRDRFEGATAVRVERRDNGGPMMRDRHNRYEH